MVCVLILVNIHLKINSVKKNSYELISFIKDINIQTTLIQRKNIMESLSLLVKNLRHVTNIKSKQSAELKKFLSSQNTNTHIVTFLLNTTNCLLNSLAISLEFVRNYLVPVSIMLMMFYIFSHSNH